MVARKERLRPGNSQQQRGRHAGESSLQTPQSRAGKGGCVSRKLGLKKRPRMPRTPGWEAEGLRMQSEGVKQ